ncbi:MAG: ATP-dependent helicase/nuclease subunit A [Candidatus Endobugula sp.]|jgi:ATP-dependent helicase/nuclease subunit A
MTHKNIPIDQPERAHALDTTASFAVSAPAGSGKTGLLTQRVLALLAQCEEPENVLAITFTKKAAAEMQSRILDALRDAEQQTTEPEADYLKTTWRLARAVLARNTEKQWELFSCPNRLRITTIDSLCRSISQQMPFESKLGHTPEILDNPNLAYQIAARETLAQLNTQNDLQAHLIHLVKHVDNKLDSIENLLIQLLSKRDQWLPILFQSKDQRSALEAVLVDVIEEHLLNTQEALAPISGELALLADHAANNFASAELAPKNPLSVVTHCLGLTDMPDVDVNAIPQWLGIAELLLTQKNELRKSPTKDIGFFAPSAKGLSKQQKDNAKIYKQHFVDFIEQAKTIPELENLLGVIRKLPSSHYDSKQWQLLDSLTHVLVNLAQNLTLAFQQLGKTDYLAVTLAALDALGEPDSPSDLALALDYKIQHVLVDEFQDTSTTQLRLLERITAGWQADDGRTLFVVGDAMQSCYRFRDANVGIFLNVREYGLGDIALEPLDLQVNFRSQHHIVDWVNDSFTHIFPSHNDSNRGAVRYNPSVSFNAALDIPAVQTHLLAYGDSTPSPRKDEAAAIVDIIQRTHAVNPKDSIALLVRSRAHAQDIIHALGAADIPYQATEIDRLNTCMPVLDCLSLTKALLYPNDRLAWLAVLRAPWCGLDMRDLLALVEHNKTDKQWPLLIQNVTLQSTTFNSTNKGQRNNVGFSPAGYQKLQRFSDVITQALSQQKRHRLRHYIQGVWLSLGGPALLINPSDEDNVHTFFGLLDHYDQGGTIAQWNDLEKAVNDLYAKPKSIKQSDAMTPPVQIMTIHKSKGLEFDSVIIPGLDKGSRSNDKELILWLERIGYSTQTHQQQSQLLISPMNATGDDTDPIYNFISHQHKEKEQLESDRVLYVACTRAIKQLHLVGYTAIDPKSESIHGQQILTIEDLKTPSKQTLLSRLWTSIEKSDTSNRHIIRCNETNADEHASSERSYIENPTEKARNKLSHPNIIVSLSEHWQAPIIQANNILAAYRGNNLLAKMKALPEKIVAKNIPIEERQTDLFGEVINHPNEESLVENSAKKETQQEPLKTAQAPEDNNERDNIAKPDALLQREQRYIGTVIHLALQHITETGYKHWNTQRIQQQQIIWQTQLAQKGISPHKLTSALATVTQAVSQTLKDKTGQWLLDNTHLQSATELELWNAKGQHIIDRTFLENNNKGKKTRWIIDYKSSQPKENETLEAFTKKQTDEYQQQLQRYKQLFKNENTEMRAGLYFVLVGIWIEV